VKGYLGTVLELLQQLKIKRTQLLNFELLGKKLFFGDASKFERSNGENDAVGSVKAKPAKGETYLITLDLLKQGKSMNEIAEIRSFSITTVASHFSRFIEKGELSIEAVMDKSKIKLMEQHYLSKPEMALTERKNELGDQVEFYELRMVEAYLRRRAALN
jgi:transposase